MKDGRVDEDDEKDEEMEVEEKEVRKDDCEVLDVINDGLGVLTSPHSLFILWFPFWVGAILVLTCV